MRRNLVIVGALAVLAIAGVVVAFQGDGNPWHQSQRPEWCNPKVPMGVSVTADALTFRVKSSPPGGYPMTDLTFELGATNGSRTWAINGTLAAVIRGEVDGVALVDGGAPGTLDTGDAVTVAYARYPDLPRDGSFTIVLRTAEGEAVGGTFGCLIVQ